MDMFTRERITTKRGSAKCRSTHLTYLSMLDRVALFIMKKIMPDILSQNLSNLLALLDVSTAEGKDLKLV